MDVRWLCAMKTKYDIILPCSEEIWSCLRRKISVSISHIFTADSKCYIPEERGVIIVLRTVFRHCQNLDQLTIKRDRSELYSPWPYHYPTQDLQLHNYLLPLLKRKHWTQSKQREESIPRQQGSLYNHFMNLLARSLIKSKRKRPGCEKRSFMEVVWSARHDNETLVHPNDSMPRTVPECQYLYTAPGRKQNERFFQNIRNFFEVVHSNNMSLDIPGERCAR